MKTVQIRMQRPHQGQKQVLDNLRRFNVVACGRRFGKTALGVIVVVQALLEGKRVAWMGPYTKTVEEAWNMIYPILEGLKTRSRINELLTLQNGGSLEMWSLDKPATMRGRKYHLVIIDEASFIPDLENKWNFIIRPLLTDYRGQAIFLSTPDGYNMFYTLWMRHHNGEQNWMSWRLPTSANPFISKEELEEIRESVPELPWRQEYEAEFLAESGAVFTISDYNIITEPVMPIRCVAGIDFGKKMDYTVVTVMDADRPHLIDMLRIQGEYIHQIPRVEEFIKRNNVVCVYGEQNSMGDVLIEMLERRGVAVNPFHTNVDSKARLVTQFAVGLERGEVKIINNQVLMSEIAGYKQDRLPSGKYSYHAPRGRHDDAVVSAMLCYEAFLQQPKGVPRIGLIKNTKFDSYEVR